MKLLLFLSNAGQLETHLSLGQKAFFNLLLPKKATSVQNGLIGAMVL